MTLAEQLHQEGRQEGHQEGRQEGVLVGHGAGLRAAVLSVLEARGLPLTEAERTRVEACESLVQLEQWVRSAVTVQSADQLFDRQ